MDFKCKFYSQIIIYDGFYNQILRRISLPKLRQNLPPYLRRILRPNLQRILPKRIKNFNLWIRFSSKNVKLSKVTFLRVSSIEHLDSRNPSLLASVPEKYVHSEIAGIDIKIKMFETFLRNSHFVFIHLVFELFII